LTNVSTSPIFMFAYRQKEIKSEKEGARGVYGTALATKVQVF